MKITRIEPVSIFWITPRYAGTNLSSKMAGYVKSIKFSLINNYTFAGLKEAQILVLRFYIGLIYECKKGYIYERARSQDGKE